MKDKAIIRAVLLTGDDFKALVNHYFACAVYNHRSKTTITVLRAVYKDLYNRFAADKGMDPADMTIYRNLFAGYNTNKLNYIANLDIRGKYKVNAIAFKADFVRLLMEKAGV